MKDNQDFITKNPKNRTILLPRVSSLHQAKQGDSVSSQEEKLIKHSKDNDDEIIGIYTDAGKSASISEDKIDILFKEGKFIIRLDLNKRAGLKRALDEIDKNLWDSAKFTKWDRLSRNSILSKILQIYFERNGKKLIPIEDSNDPLMVDIKGALGEEEINKMKARVRETRTYRFEHGIMPGRSPYGFKPIVKDKKIIGFEPKKKESEIVKGVFEMASKGVSYKDICQAFNLKPQQYYNIVKNKVYMGIITFENKERQGVHEPLVTKELWEKVNEKN
jgi:site-specific DNA recombinase